jgi:hypothetical protein
LPDEQGNDRCAIPKKGNPCGASKPVWPRREEDSLCHLTILKDG